MSLINNNRKAFILQALNAVHNIRELLDRCCNDLRIAVEGDSEVGRIALFVHHTDKPRLMLHTHDRFLKLSVNNHSVGHDDNIIENDLVVSIMECRKAVCKPSNSIGLAGACTVLDQIVERGAVFLYIGKELADCIELMITGKNNTFLDFYLSCLFILFLRGLNENEFGDQVENGIFGKNIVPHIMYRIIVLTGSVSCTCIDTLTVALIERQEESLFTVELRCHIDFVQVHSEIDECACLE